MDADCQHRRNNDHLDASAGVDGIEAFYEQCVANGVTIIKPIKATECRGMGGAAFRWVDAAVMPNNSLKNVLTPSICVLAHSYLQPAIQFNLAALAQSSLPQSK